MAFGILRGRPDERGAPEEMPAPEELRLECDGRVDAAYRNHYGLLWAIATEKFQVPVPEADNVVQDVFVTFLRRHASIRNERAWLVGAICHASRTYWRRKGQIPPTDELPEDDSAPEDVRHGRTDAIVGARLDAQTLMSGLRTRCQDLLRLHYCDELTASEIASIYGKTERYTKLMLHRCLCAARKLLVAGRRQ